MLTNEPTGRNGDAANAYENAAQVGMRMCRTVPETAHMGTAVAQTHQTS